MKLFLLLASFFTTSLSLVAQQIHLYVATDGSDFNLGTIDSPFATITKARNHIRSLQPLTEGAIVHIREGEYFLDNQIDFSGAQDSGQAGAPIIYEAYNGEKVILSGAQKIDRSAFSPVTEPGILNRIIDLPTRSKLLQVDLDNQSPPINPGTIVRRGWGGNNTLFPDNNPSFDLIVGGQRQILARWPNKSSLPLNNDDPLGSVDIEQVLSPGSERGDIDYTTRGGTFSYNFTTNRPALWPQAQDIWISGPLDRAWEWDYIPVNSIDPTSQHITLGQGTDSGLTTFESFFHFENLLEEIDEPGEYYVDRNTNILYIYPTADFDTAPIRATSLSSFWMIQTNNVEHLQFHDLIFEGARRGIMRLYGDHLQVQRCTFRNSRGIGIQISGENLKIADSLFHHLGSNGIIVGAWGPDSGIGDTTDLTPGTAWIDNCEFHNLSYYKANYTPAIQLLRSVSPRISHCYFHDNPHFSIGGADNNGVIEYCEFENTPYLLRDVGAIYYNTGSRPQAQGTLIRRNYFHDIGNDVERGKMSALYLDNASRGFTIEENIFHRIGAKSDDWAFFNHGPGPVAFNNNIFVDCVNPVNHAFALAIDTYMRISNFVPSWESILGTPGQPNLLHEEYLLQYPELASLIPANGDYSTRTNSTSTYSRNLFYNPNISRLNNTDGTDDGIELGFANAISPTEFNKVFQTIDNHVANSDPGFIDLQNGNFSFNNSASVFNSIPNFNDPEFTYNGVKQMGLTKSVGPRTSQEAPSEPSLQWDEGIFFTPKAYVEGIYTYDISPLVSDPNSAVSLSFEKVSGPDWLSITTDGKIHGSPPIERLGLNHFSVRVISEQNETSEAILRIIVIPSDSNLIANLSTPSDSSDNVPLATTFEWTPLISIPDAYRFYINDELIVETTNQGHTLTSLLDGNTAYTARVDTVFGANQIPGPNIHFISENAYVVRSISNSGEDSLLETLNNSTEGSLIYFNSNLDGQTITLDTGQLTIDKDITLDASNLPNGLTLSGNDTHRHFTIFSGKSLTLKHLHLTQGLSSTGSGGSIACFGSLTLESCSFTNNISLNDGGAISISNYNPASPSIVNIKNTTFVNNFAENRGGAIWNNGPEISLNVSHSTLTKNHANTVAYGGGAIRNNNGVNNVFVENSIIWGNSQSPNSLSNDLHSNGITLVGTNIVGHSLPTPSGVEALSSDPMLSPLGYYSSSTPVCIPLPGSPAINSAGTIDPGGTDQRMLTRFADGALDIGAVEIQSLQDMQNVLSILWNTDSDNNTLAFGLEFALASSGNTFSPLSDNLKIQTNTPGEIEMSFGINPNALPYVNWVIYRSNNLEPDQYKEVYRLNGPSSQESLDLNILSTVGVNSRSVMDTSQAGNKAFYILKAELAPITP